MAKFSGQMSRWGLVFWLHFESHIDIVVLGIRRFHIGLVAALRFKRLDSQPDSSNMGSVPTDFHDFCDFAKSCRGFLARYLPCFQAGCFQIHIFEVSGRDQKDARRKVTQIRGGMTSRSAFFDLFVPI